MSKITIGITTYNGAHRVHELLTSIELRTSQELLSQVKIVLVDDGSPDPSRTKNVYTNWANRLPIHYIQHPVNKGISAGWNTASTAFDTEYVVLINDDVIVSSGWLEALVYPLENSPGVGGVGVNWHAFLDEDVNELLAGPTSDQNVVPRDPGSKAKTPDRRKYEDCGPGRVMCPGGQLFSFRRADYNIIGGFDETYKSFFEESDFGTAMAAKLGKIGLQLNYPMCWHRWSATFSTNPELAAHTRMTASRKHYIQKWNVPSQFQGDKPGPFDYTNPKHLGIIPAVEVKYLKKDGTEGIISL